MTPRHFIWEHDGVDRINFARCNLSTLLTCMSLPVNSNDCINSCSITRLLERPSQYSLGCLTKWYPAETTHKPQDLYLSVHSLTVSTGKQTLHKGNALNGSILDVDLLQRIHLPSHSAFTNVNVMLTNSINIIWSYHVLFWICLSSYFLYFCNQFKYFLH